MHAFTTAATDPVVLRVEVFTEGLGIELLGRGNSHGGSTRGRPGHGLIITIDDGEDGGLGALSGDGLDGGVIRSGSVSIHLLLA